MVTLNKVFDDLLAVSQGDVARFSRATEEFARDIMRTNRIPWQPAAPAEVPSAEARSNLRSTKPRYANINKTSCLNVRN